MMSKLVLEVTIETPSCLLLVMSSTVLFREYQSFSNKTLGFVACLSLFYSTMTSDIIFPQSWMTKENLKSHIYLFGVPFYLLIYVENSK